MERVEPRSGPERLPLRVTVSRLVPPDGGDDPGGAIMVMGAEDAARGLQTLKRTIPP